MKVKKREVLGSCGVNDEERTSHAMNHGTEMTAAELAPLYGMVIASCAFNLSMQVLRYLTFPPRGSPLPLSASDGVEHSRVQGHCVGGREGGGDPRFCCLQACARASRNAQARVHERPRSSSAHVAKRLRPRRRKLDLTRCTAKITCVQTVIASQTIRTAITHFLKVNVLKQGGAASPAHNLTKDPQGR